MRYLITGGAGFIGSHLTDALIARGDRVVVLDDLSTGRIENLDRSIGSSELEFVHGCVTDAELVGRLMVDADICIHLASAVGVQLVVSEPLDTLRRIVSGSDTVITAAATHGTRLLYASTSEVYGKSDGTALDEQSDRILGSPLKSRWSYAIAKSYGESLAYSYHRDRGADTTIFRLFNTVGPRQQGMYGMVVPRLVSQALAGEDLTVFGDGTQSRCFLHVADAVRAIIGIAERGASGHAYNIGNPEPVTIEALARRVIARTRTSSQVRFVPYAEAYEDGFEELGRRRPNITAVQELLGWTPQFTLDDALDDVIAALRPPVRIYALRQHEPATTATLQVPAIPGRTAAA